MKGGLNETDCGKCKKNFMKGRNDYETIQKVNGIINCSVDDD